MINEEELNEALDDSIDLTPLLDVVFLLLIFFIMATTFTKPVVDVLLPVAESSERPGASRQLLLVVDERGRVFHEGRELARSGLADFMDRDRDLPLNVHVDQRAPFEAFMAVLDAAKSKGRDNFAITTRHTSEEP